MAAAPQNLLHVFPDLLGRAGSPAVPGAQQPGGGPTNGLQFQTREEAQMFLQAAGRAQQNGGNPNGIALTRDAVAALQHAAHIAAINQAKLGQGGVQNGGNGSIRPPGMVMPQLGNNQNPSLANLHSQAQLQAAMNAQRAAAVQAAAQQQQNSNNQAALLLMQNQLAQAQAANNNPFNLQNGLQNNPIAAAAAAAAAVAATTQAAQARAAAVGNASLLQLQQAAQAAGLQRPQAMAWAQNQALQNAAMAQQNLAATLQAQQARATLQVQQMAQQQAAAAAAAARPLQATPQNVAAAQQLQMLRQLQARLNAAQGPGAAALAAAAAPQSAAAKPTEVQLQALRTALARNAAGRAALNAANVLGNVNGPRAVLQPNGNGAGQPPGLNSLQQAINLQLLLQQQRNNAQANAINNLAIQQGNAAAALNGQLAALQQAAANNAAAQRPPMQNNTAAALAGIAGMGNGNAAAINEVLLQNLQKMQLAKAMENAGAQSMPMAPEADKGAQGGDSAASNSSKEQRRLALACVALQLARGGMTVEQAINSGIMGGMSVTDVKFIVECYNAERQRMQSEGQAPDGGGQQQGGPSPGMQGGPGQQQHPGGQGMPHMGLPPGMSGMLPGLLGAMQQGQHHQGQGGMGASPPLPFAPSPATPGSPAPAGAANGMHRDAHGRPMHGSASSAPASPPRSTGQGSPAQRSLMGGSDVDAHHDARSEGCTSEQLAADAAATMAALAKEPFDAFSYDFFGAPIPGGGGGGGGVDELLGALEPDSGELEGGLEGRQLSEHRRPSAGGLGELDPDQAAWLQAAASANQAMWAGDGTDDGPLNNDEMVARLANLDLGSGFF